MLSISIPMKGAGKGEYYLRLAQEDYYFNRGEPLGQWYGKGAEKLGLTGRIDPVAMRRLLDGFSPDGRRALVQNPGNPDRQSGWDLTFSAPKSVSVLWALAPESVRREIEAIHEAALQVVLDFLQAKAALTRRGKEGRQREHADFTLATFRHSVSRELDMLLHTHALLINVCLRRDGTTGTVWSRAFFKLKKKAGAVYAQALADGFKQRLGLQVEAEKVGFHVTGIPRALCREFSKRRQQIETYLAKRGQSGAVAAKNATLRTRKKKVAVSRQELFVQWRQTAEQFGWSQKQIEELLARARQEKNGHATTPDPARSPSTPHVAPSTASSEAGQNGANQSHRPAQESSSSTIRQPEQGPARGPSANKESRESQREAGPNPDGQSKQQSQHSEKPSPDEETTSKRKESKKQRGNRRRRVRRRAKQNGRTIRNQRKSWPQGTRIWTRIVWEKDLIALRLRVQHKRLFPKAPFWSPARKWSLPAVRVLTPKPAPAWAKIVWRKRILGLELRLQQRRLFPKAPPWSPAREWKLPALRLTPESSTFSQPKDKTKDQSHHH